MRRRSARHVRAYRVLLLLYPGDFRRQFGPELVRAFQDQFHHPLRTRRLPRVAVWFSTIADLATSVPRQRLEVLMSRFSPPARAFVIATLALASITAVVLVGSQVPFALPLVALIFVVAAVRRRRQLVEAVEHGMPWYVIVATGIGLLGLLALGDQLVPDVQGALASALFYLALTSFLLGWLLILAGVAIGIFGAWRRVKHARA